LEKLVKNSLNTEFSDGFKLRTRKHAVAVIKFLRTIKSNDEISIIKRQLIRCVTSVAANYRATCRARSKADFISKLGIVHEEADEVLFWFEILEDLDYGTGEHKKLKNESEEILKIVAKSISTSRANHQLQSQ
jgi:four helix bundle protein